jgi:type II secretory ATPase GspE/PulE/Tfp pilus assembly ATPase PilB-like protein
MNNHQHNTQTPYSITNKVLKNILDQALLFGVQEIHLEPNQHNLLVSYRQYADLNEPIVMPLDLQPEIFAQIKL